MVRRRRSRRRRIRVACQIRRLVRDAREIVRELKALLRETDLIVRETGDMLVQVAALFGLLEVMMRIAGIVWVNH